MYTLTRQGRFYIGCLLALLYVVVANTLRFWDSGHLDFGFHIYYLVLAVLIAVVWSVLYFVLFLVALFWNTPPYMFIGILVGLGLLLLIFIAWNQLGPCPTYDWFSNHQWFPLPSRCTLGF